jgi:uncharacterized membrane protein YdjX (TVP38/TMEM64 family)
VGFNIEKRVRRRLIINAALIAVFMAAAALAAIKYGSYFTHLVSNPSELKVMLSSYGWKGIFVFVAIQVVQVVIVVIPGDLVQFTGGYIYGPFAGTLISMAGILIGSAAAFYIAKLLGYSLVRELFSKSSMAKFDFVINSNKLEIVLFILFLIPGFPKDMLTYIAGLTPIKPLRLFAVVVVARLPGLLASSFIGHSTQQENYLTVAVLSVVVLIIFIAVLLNKDRILNALHRHK